MAAASVLAMSAPVQAAKFLITYTGTVSDGFDTSGEFGAPNTDLTGLSFVAQYTLDTSGNAVSDNVGTSRQIFGGTQRSTDSPLFGSVTINHRTSTSIGKYLGFVSYTNDFDGSTGFIFDSLSHNAYDKVNDSVNDIENTLGFGIFNPMNGLINSSDYTQDTNYTVRRSGSLPDSARGDLRIYE